LIILAKGLEMLGAIVNSTEGHSESGGNLKATGESDLWISDSNMANLSHLCERRIINDENPALRYSDLMPGVCQEVREYLLEKCGRKCAYCGAENVPLEIEHIHPRSKGGSNCVSNLTLACAPCNQAKGNQDVKQFLNGKPDLLKRVLVRAKAPLKDAAAINASRWALFNALKSTGLPVSTGSGAQTKFNRRRLGLLKTHWLDAACVGNIEALEALTTQPLLIKSAGHGRRQVIQVDKYGFPRHNQAGELVRKSAQVKQIKGFQTGNIVRAIVPSGKKTGVYIGRVAIRSSGSFNIKTPNGTVEGISFKHCSFVQRKDGYSYSFSDGR
ncbi:MAG: HNH endonuclease, partial [Okeania sp. SIO2D1]|nr:HNH endonuclease [Okeania sp. SIO2D1]